jgi:spore germination protein GerM
MSHRRRTACMARAIVVVSLVAAACGSSNGQSATTATTTSSSNSTVSTTSRIPATSTTSGVTTTTSPSTTAPATTSAPAVQVAAPARIWFVREERLVPAYRSSTNADETIRALLAGPTSTDPAGVSTAIPSGTVLHGVRIAGSVATIDLDQQYQSGGGSLSMTERIGQIVFTLTELPGVTGVAFAFDGVPASFIGGEGFDVRTPVGRDSFPDLKPFILVSEPRPGQIVTSPLHILGENSTYENNVEIALRTSDGRLLVQTFATGTGPIMDREGRPLWGRFETWIDFYAGGANAGVLTLTESAADGSGRLLAEFSIPLSFESTTPNPPAPLDGASTAAVLVPSTGCCEPGPFTFLTKVSAERLPGLDRVVFEFTAPVANYHLRYVELPVTFDPSDLPVALQGDSALQISMAATGLDMTGPSVLPTYAGPFRITLGKGSIIELVQTGDFEAVLNWTAGLRGKPPFRVAQLTNPSRLVIDVASELVPTM